MRWRIREIEIQGFKSFKEKQTFTFDDLPLSAFIFISGENLVELELEANGSGKSSLFDAVMYLFFGRTVTVKGTDLENWTLEKRCTVKGTLVDDTGKEYIIARSRQPNELTSMSDNKPAKDIDQAQLEELIGYNLKSFEYSVIMTQFSRHFFDLDPSEKMKLFDSVIGEELTLWIQKSDKAKSKSSELDCEIAKDNEAIAYTRGQLVSMDSKDFTALVTEWESERQKELAELTARQQDLLYKKEGLSDKRKEASEQLKDVTESFKEEEQTLLHLREEYETFRNSLTEIEKVIAGLERDYSSNEKAIKEMQGIEGFCPTCRQKVEAKHLKQELETLALNSKTISDTIKTKKGMLALGKQEAGKINQKISEAQNQIALIATKKMEIEKQVLYSHDADSILDKDLQSCKDKTDEISKKANPYKEQEAKTKRACTSLKRKIEHIEKALGDKEKQKGLCQYWIKGFKEIRYMVVKKAIWDLEIYINDYLHKLGLSDDWGVKLEMDRETQSKTISKGFTVYISSPESKDKLVPFECWSGGEGQRLRLAGSLGFMDFIRERKGKDWSFEVWDEPTAWLAESGIEDLLQVLKDRAEVTQKQIFIVDHRSFKSLGVFDAEVQITKTKEGSKICIC